MPVFEGLLPEEHNSNTMGLLFSMVHWHALAKLRQHTDLSLIIMEAVTVQLGQSLRNFQEKTCCKYATKELKREESARVRKSARGKKSAVSKSSSSGKKKAASKPATVTTGKQSKFLNLNTYKDHALGDYVETIRQYGTTDSYSTEAVRLCFHFPSVPFDFRFIADGTGAPLSEIAVP